MNSKLTTLYKHYEEIMQELSSDVIAKDRIFGCRKDGARFSKHY